MKNLKVILFTTLFMLIATTSISAEGAQSISKNYSVNVFSSIQANTMATIIYTQSSITSVRVDGFEEMIDQLNIKVHNDVLYIENNIALNNQSSTPLVVFVSSPRLNSIETSGIGDWCLNGKVKTDNLKIASNGIGSIHALDLQCKKILVKYDAIGNMKLGGKTQVVEITSTGVGAIDCKNLIAETALVRSTNSGHVNCYASKNIGLFNEGIGEITYYGNPSCKNLSNGGLGKIIAAK